MKVTVVTFDWVDGTTWQGMKPSPNFSVMHNRPSQYAFISVSEAPNPVVFRFSVVPTDWPTARTQEKLFHFGTRDASRAV